MVMSKEIESVSYSRCLKISYSRGYEISSFFLSSLLIGEKKKQASYEQKINKKNRPSVFVRQRNIINDRCL